MHPTSHVAAAPALSSRPYACYVLALLWCVALLRFVDMQILAVLLEPIRSEFHLSDTQLGLLGGLAFALFYGVLGVPVAWLADRCNRRAIIAVAVALWSAMTALGGYATGFTQLFLSRVGVGIGEAGAYPPSTSLLADYFAPHQRLRALAILASAIPAGVFVGYLAGGLAAQAWGWRAALQIVGLPGLLIGLLVWLTIREPERGAMDEQRGPVAPAEPLVLALRALASNAAYCHVVAGACLFTLGATGSGVWIASYFIRQHGFTGAEIGLWLALLYGGGGICGTLCGGWLAEKTGASARLCAVSLVLALPFTPYVFLGSDRILTLLLHLPVTVLMHMNTGPVLTLIQQLCGAHRRAVAHAVSVMISNLVALPLGPLLVGLFSDQFAPLFGAQALGIGITLLLITTWPMAAWQFTRAANAIGAEYNISGPRPVGPLKPGQAPASLRATL